MGAGWIRPELISYGAMACARLGYSFFLAVTPNGADARNSCTNYWLVGTSNEVERRYKARGLPRDTPTNSALELY
jgi:hypothetical protein